MSELKHEFLGSGCFTEAYERRDGKSVLLLTAITGSDRFDDCSKDMLSAPDFPKTKYFPVMKKLGTHYGYTWYVTKKYRTIKLEHERDVLNERSYQMYKALYYHEFELLEGKYDSQFSELRKELDVVFTYMKDHTIYYFTDISSNNIAADENGNLVLIDAFVCHRR